MIVVSLGGEAVNIESEMLRSDLPYSFEVRLRNNGSQYSESSQTIEFYRGSIDPGNLIGKSPSYARLSPGLSATIVSEIDLRLLGLGNGTHTIIAYIPESGKTLDNDIVVDSPPTVVTVPHPSQEFDPFYKKYLDWGGIPILGSENVPDEAFYVAQEIANNMFLNRQDLKNVMIAENWRIGIMAEAEVTTDIPEHKNLYEMFPDVDWDNRARGLGGTLENRITTAAEENLLTYGSVRDRYYRENILIHELAHPLMNVALRNAPDGNRILDQIVDAYDSALRDGLWNDTYAATNAHEYWAEGVQSWFNANAESIPSDGVHNSVNTKEELQTYDPKLAKILFDVFRDNDWRYVRQ